MELLPEGVPVLPEEDPVPEVGGRGGAPAPGLSVDDISDRADEFLNDAIGAGQGAFHWGVDVLQENEDNQKVSKWTGGPVHEEFTAGVAALTEERNPLVDGKRTNKAELRADFIPRMDQHTKLMPLRSDVHPTLQGRPEHPLAHINPETKYGKDVLAALAISPAMRNFWVDTSKYEVEVGWFRAIRDAGDRDSFYQQGSRWIAQLAAEADESPEETAKILQNKDGLTDGIPQEYWKHILGMGSFEVAEAESIAIRHRLEMQEREATMGTAKMLGASLGGYITSPSNFIPAITLFKTIQGVDRAARLVRGASRARKYGRIPGQPLAYSAPYNLDAVSRTAGLAAFGGTEEAIRLSPRMMADPTYTREEYMMSILGNAVFTGMMPAWFAGFKKAKPMVKERMADLGAAVDDKANKWGLDVHVRQAMRTPGEFKANGWKDWQGAARTAKEKAQHVVDTKWKENKARSNAKQHREAMDNDLNADTPGGEATSQFFKDYLNTVSEGIKRRARTSSSRSDAPQTARQQTKYERETYNPDRRPSQNKEAAYQAAQAAGDEDAAAQILRADISGNTRADATTGMSPEEIDAHIDGLSKQAQTRLDEVVQNAKTRMEDNGAPC